MHLPGLAEPVGRDRAPDLQAPAEAPRRRGRGGPRRPGPPARPERRARRRGRGEGRAAAAPGRALGQRPGPGRLVDEREARRRPRLLGRQDPHLPAGQPRSTPPTGSSTGLPDDPARRRALDRPQGVPADRRHRPPAGQDRPLEGGHLRRLRRPGARRPVRGPARRPSATTSSATGRPTCGHTSTPVAPAWTTSAPSWRGSRRSAARADAPPAGLALRGRPVDRRC